ncbi:MAG TPA: carboxypeptidase regulatory-like domain-containing protein, partial [Blastocatellia bacterium]|nr:carboxypeptidase regulatory-like domain-containing protein [Blastocatellia bacterium]
MTQKSKFVRLFLAAALILAQLPLAGIAAITGKTEIKSAAFPDTITGTLEGDVFDAGGLPIPGVSIRVTNLETGNTRATQTDAAGHYRITFLPLGVYKIEATKEGFFIKETSSIQSSIKIQVNKTFNRVPPIIMSAGPPPQAPVVAAAQPTPTPQQSAPLAKDDITGQLTTQFDSTRRSNADEQMVALLPLANVRSFDDLALLAAGVAPPPQVRGAAGPGIGSGIGTPGQFSVNGQRARSNNFTVDGSDNNDEDVGVRRQGFVALVPQSIESVKEIQIVTHLWDAEQGRSIGSQVNAVSKSGTNQIHGTAYDFFNHSALNARNFFDYSSKNAPPTALTGLDAQQYVNGQPVSTRRIPVQINGTNVVLPNPSQGKDQFQRNQGGATLGFPILKERTFFFGSFERQDIKARQETHFAVPTVTQRGFLGFGATGFTARDDQGNSGIFPAAFPAGDSVFSLFPFPNNPIGPYGANTLTQVLPADARGTIFSLKFDHNFNLFGQATHILTGRYNFTDDEKQVPVVGGAIFSGVVPKVRTQNLSLFLNSQLSAARANQFRASYGRTALTFNELRDAYLQKSFYLPNEPFLLNAPTLANNSGPINSQAVLYITRGARDVIGTENALGSVGQVIITPFSPVGLDVYLFPQARANNTIQFADTLTWFRASHIYKFGADVRRTQLNSLLNRNYRPQVLFGGTPDLTADFSEAPLKRISQFGPTPGYFTGTDLASLGLPTGIFQSLGIGTPDSTIGLRFWQLNFFTNDNWRVRRGLTLDYGVRYELNTVPREVNSRIEKTFALNQLPTSDPSFSILRQLSNGVFQPLNNQTLLNSYNATINALQQTVGARDGIFDLDRNNFGGHIGFAWDPFASNKDQSGKTVIRGGIGAYYDLTLGSVVSQSRNVFPTSIPINVDANTFGYIRNQFYFPGSGVYALFNPNYLRIPVVKDRQLTELQLIGTSTQNQLNAIQLPSGVLPQLLGLLFNPTVAGTLPSGGGLAFTLPNNDLRSPYALQYNLQIERELFSDFLVNLAYVGTRGVKLTRFRTPNGGPNSITVPIDPIGLRSLDPILAISYAPLSDLANKRFTRPNPNLGAFTIFDSSAASNYHSLQTSVTKRFAGGYQFTTAYTWSHAIDDVSDVFDVGGAFALPQDDRALQLERGSANFDIRHRLALSVIGNLPFLARFNDAGGAGKFFLGGWQFAAFSTFQTGQPFTVNSSIDVNLDGNLTDRINTLNGLTNIDSRRERLRLTTGTSNLLAPLGTNGQIGRNTFRA